MIPIYVYIKCHSATKIKKFRSNICVSDLKYDFFVNTVILEFWKCCILFFVLFHSQLNTMDFKLLC